MDSDTLKKLAIAGGLLFAAFKYGNPMVKGAAVAVGAGIVAKRIPYIKDVV